VAYGIALDAQARVVVGGYSEGYVGLARLSGTVVLDVPPAPVRAGLSLAAPYPNPAHSGADLAFELGGPGVVTAEVLDVGGRRVCALSGGAFPPGRHVVRWDGRDGAGHPVAGGVYFVRVRTAGALETRRVCVVR
jgi:hypothetical protein